MGKNIEADMVFNPASSIDYAEKSIVSKSILKKTGGNISLFAFDKGEGLSEHSSPHVAMVHVLDGQAEVRIQGRLHLVKASECIILPANVPHALYAPEKFKMMLIMIKNA